MSGPDPATRAPPAAAVVVRDAGPEDLAAIGRIYAHYVLHGTGTFEEEVPSPEDMARRFAGIQARGMPWIVAGEADGGIAGFAYFDVYRARRGYRYTAEDSIYVDAACTGRGIGRLLLAELVRRATDLGFRQMIAVVGDSGNAASIRVHESCGFQHAGTLVSAGRKFGRWVDSMLMQRALGEGDTSDP